MKSLILVCLFFITNVTFAEDFLRFYKKTPDKEIFIIKSKKKKILPLKRSLNQIKKKSNRSINQQLTSFPQIELLKERSYKVFNSKEIKSTVNQYISAMESTCNSNMDKEKKLEIIKENLNRLRTYSSDMTKNHFLNVNDLIYLTSIHGHTSEKRIPYKKENANCEDIKSEFNHYYAYSYNIQDDTPLQDYPHLWAIRVIKSLNCICGK